MSALLQCHFHMTQFTPHKRGTQESSAALRINGRYVFMQNISSGGKTTIEFAFFLVL